MKTLPDLLCPGLLILSIGLNPSPRSVQTGVYFAPPSQPILARARCQ